MKEKKSWVDGKYTTERFVFKVEVDISYRIRKHRTVLISKMKRQLKQVLNDHNTNVLRVKKVSKIDCGENVRIDNGGEETEQEDK